MTEDEAKTKDCCGPRMLATAFLLPHDKSAGQSLVNRASRCIASECMAWRWLDETVTSDNETFKRVHAHGHCGLAGEES